MGGLILNECQGENLKYMKSTVPTSSQKCRKRKWKI